MSNREIEARLKISAIDRTGKVLANVGNKLENLNMRATAFNRVNSAIGAQLLMMGRYVGPAALGLELYRATGKAADFETSLFNIQKKSNATTEQMKMLGDQLRQMSHEMPLSLTDLAAGMERGAAAGLPIDELEKFAKLTAMVADGWEVSSEEAGNFIAGFNKGMHVPMEQMQAYASLINDLADSGIADEKDIADFVDRVGASLQNFGMTPNEVAAYGASFLNLKMPAEVGARAMDTLTGKLMAPENLGKKSRNALADIVGDLGKFAKLSGNEKMNRFMSSLQKMTNQRRASLLGALMGEGFDDEIMRLVSGIDEVKRNLDMAHRQAEKPSSSITTMYEKQLQTFNKQVELLKNNFGDIELRLGNRLLPLANAFVSTINKGLEEHDKFVAGQDKISQGDPGLYKLDKKEFMAAYERYGFVKKKNYHDGLPMMAWRKAVMGVESGQYKTTQDYIQELINRYDPEGKIAAQYKAAKYQHAEGPGIGAYPSQYSIDKPPTPEFLKDVREKERKDRAAANYAEVRRNANDSPIVDMPRLIEEAKTRERHRKEDAQREAAMNFTLDVPLRPGEAAHFSDQTVRDVQAHSPKTSDTVIQAAIARLKAERAAREGTVSLAAQDNAPRVDPNNLLGALFSSNAEAAGQKMASGGDEAGKAISAAAVEFQRIISAAASALAAQLANLKVNVNAQGITPGKVNANTGQTNTFAKSPASLGHQ